MLLVIRKTTPNWLDTLVKSKLDIGVIAHLVSVDYSYENYLDVMEKIVQDRIEEGVLQGRAETVAALDQVDSQAAGIAAAHERLANANINVVATPAPTSAAHIFGSESHTDRWQHAIAVLEDDPNTNYNNLVDDPDFVLAIQHVAYQTTDCEGQPCPNGFFQPLLDHDNQVYAMTNGKGQWAEMPCFTCGNHGHLARHCPKKEQLGGSMKFAPATYTARFPARPAADKSAPRSSYRK
jgi:hypothetical protein